LLRFALCSIATTVSVVLSESRGLTMAKTPVEWLANELASIAERFEAAQQPPPEGGGTDPACRAALSSLARLQTMLRGPSEFIQHLATEVPLGCPNLDQPIVTM